MAFHQIDAIMHFGPDAEIASSAPAYSRIHDHGYATETHTYLRCDIRKTPEAATKALVFRVTLRAVEVADAAAPEDFAECADIRGRFLKLRPEPGMEPSAETQQHVIDYIAQSVIRPNRLVCDHLDEAALELFLQDIANACRRRVDVHLSDSEQTVLVQDRERRVADDTLRALRRWIRRVNPVKYGYGEFYGGPLRREYGWIGHAGWEASAHERLASAARLAQMEENPPAFLQPDEIRGIAEDIRKLMP